MTGSVTTAATDAVATSGVPTRPGLTVVDTNDVATGFVGHLVQDWSVNAGRPDSRLVLVVFRLSQWAARRWGRPGRLVVLAAQVFNSVVFGVELPAACVIGPRLRLYHPHSIVLNPGVRIGADLQLRHNTTLGNVVDRDGTERGNPVLGDDVDLGATCAVLGPVRVGSGARIGALAVVTRDVPARGVAVGNPARVLRVDEPSE